MIKTLHCTGKHQIGFYNWHKPEINDNQIEVETKFCGICRSDIGNFMGAEDMPYDGQVGCWGHEGVGVVNKIGKNIFDVKVGDYVATWSDPAYSTLYNADNNQYVKIPELSYKYILQPVACALNIYEETAKLMRYLRYRNSEILLIGTGFMSIIINQYLNSDRLHILGNNNLQYFENNKVYKDIKDIPDDSYKVIIDLSSKASNFYELSRISQVEGLISYASTPYIKVITNFFDNCWKCNIFTMPSPRNRNFNEKMKLAAFLINNGRLQVENLWSAGYHYNDLNDVARGFMEGEHRQKNYIRGYLKY